MPTLPVQMDFAGTTIRSLSALEDFQAAEGIQQQIWGLGDPTWVIPSNLLLTAQKNGGLVAGAFDDSGTMVGVLFGFLGMTQDGHFKHCSHIMGIIPAVRRQNIGRGLKLFQREYVRAQGLDLITWTYDPLEGVNASLNIGRLGAIARNYYENLYGFWQDTLNAGLPTDRFEVEWHINSPRVAQFVETERVIPTLESLTEARFINSVQLDDMSVLIPVDSYFDLETPTLLLEVPPEFQAIKLVAMETAQVWRTHTNALFNHYFGRGYAVTDFLSERVQGRRRNVYVLTRFEAS
jgi:predicted GNAT superfamily acetyltransferase